MPDRLVPPAGTVVRLGVALFGLGTALVAIAIVPFFFGRHNWPLWLNLGCLLAPVGAVMATWAGLARGRADARQASRDVERLATSQRR